MFKTLIIGKYVKTIFSLENHWNGGSGDGLEIGRLPLKSGAITCLNYLSPYDNYGIYSAFITAN